MKSQDIAHFRSLPLSVASLRHNLRECARTHMRTSCNLSAWLPVGVCSGDNSLSDLTAEFRNNPRAADAVGPAENLYTSAVLAPWGARTRVCVCVSEGVSSCVQYSRSGSPRPVKSSACSCKAMHDCAIPRSAGCAKPSGPPRPQSIWRCASAARFEQQHMRFPASVSHRPAQFPPSSLRSRNAVERRGYSQSGRAHPGCSQKDGLRPRRPVRAGGYDRSRPSLRA